MSPLTNARGMDKFYCGKEIVAQGDNRFKTLIQSVVIRIINVDIVLQMGYVCSLI